MLRRTVAAAGNPTSYAGYAFLLFVIYLLYNTYIADKDGPLQPGVQAGLYWIYTLVVNPFFLAGVCGAIYEQQRSQGETGIGEFLANARRFCWPIASANLLYVGFSLSAAMALSAAFRSVPVDTAAEYVNALTSAISLFWFASIVTERGLFRSLWRAVQLLLSNPLALTLGILWGLFRFADSAWSRAAGTTIPLPMNAAEAAIVATARVLATVYAVALYRQVRGEALEAQQTALNVPDAGQQTTNEHLINVSLGFAIVSFVPLVHLAALLLGIKAARSSQRFYIRSAIAICVGAFFTTFYALLIAAWLIAGSIPSQEPGYAFLAQANPALAQAVTLLEQHSYEQAQGQLESMSASSSSSGWTVDCALAIAIWHNQGVTGALDKFYAASQLKPDRSEFYYYYGRALLQNGKPTLAAEQFRNAALHGTGLALAERYASLADSAYAPSQIVTVAFTIVILLILFTLHEYGHAYMARKLGDDTAERLGRLTLNPIRHLDLMGSIILPGLLLWQKADVIFGWARPVPVNPGNFKDPPKDHMRVSFAGPAVNLMVAMACFLLLGGLAIALRLFWPETLTWRFASPLTPLAVIGPPFSAELTIIVLFVKQLMYTSLALGVFNLIPIPPLDGAWILEGMLPQSWRGVVGQLRRFGFVVLLVLALTPVVTYIVTIPVVAGWEVLQVLISAVGLG